MKTFTEKSRKWLRNIFLALGVAAISLVFQACYGMPMDDWDDEWNWDDRPKSEEEEPSEEI